MDLVSRLKQYLDSRQISVTQFADECGIPRPTASQLLAGRNKKVSDEIIGKIHQCYPDLNVIWLMFGEGDMVTGANIKTSEPQNDGIFGFPPEQSVDLEQSPAPNQPLQNYPENQREKIDIRPAKPASPLYDTTVPKSSASPVSSAGEEFRFSSPTSPVPDPTPTFTFSAAGRPSDPSASTSTRQDVRPQESSPRPITLTPGKGKRVTGIVVYYDDSTYESFIPDPDHSTPFLR